MPAHRRGVRGRNGLSSRARLAAETYRSQPARRPRENPGERRGNYTRLLLRSRGACEFGQGTAVREA